MTQYIDVVANEDITNLSGKLLLVIWNKQPKRNSLCGH